MDPEVLYSRAMGRRSKEGSFRSHLDQLVKQFEELKTEHSKIRSSLREMKVEV